MNAAKYTPGPWELNGMAIEIPDRFNVGMTATLARIYDERDIALDPAEIRANAHLIAAAPELLEALKDFVNASIKFASCDPDIVGFLDSQKQFDDSVEKTVAVIAKAEGAQ